MARQGLMDDCGYQGFEECSRYEDCCNEAYEQGYAEAKKEINEIMDMDVPISNIIYELDKWLKERKNED